jgi:hypothetical protein
MFNRRKERTRQIESEIRRVVLGNTKLRYLFNVGFWFASDETRESPFRPTHSNAWIPPFDRDDRPNGLCHNISELYH